MRNRIENFLDRLKQLHGNEGGAVMLLLLASFLILFMLAMTMFDSGIAAQDKMDVQIASDASSFSHSVVKSRSMNMIVYANIIKRMFFSYSVSYVNGLSALISVTAQHTALCLRMCGPIPCPRLQSCWELIENSLIIISELVEAIPNLRGLGLIPGLSGSSTAVNELVALERYQQYMFSITPWWAWVENATRAMDNGAMATASWPPPSSGIDKVKETISSTVGNIDSILGSSLMGMLPSHTNSVDVLPVTRRDRQVDWSTSVEPFKFEVSAGYIPAAIEYCLAWTGSMEQIVVSAQTIASPAGRNYEWFARDFIILQILGGSVGCALTNFAWYLNAEGAHLDWVLNSGEYKTDNDWLKATSVLTYAYKPRSGRNDNEEGRSKFTIVNQDYQRSALPGRNVEGYFGVSRSELVYKKALGTGSGGVLGGVLNTIGQIPLLGDRMGVQDEPDMWSPRWTARNRPVTLPGEKLGSATGGTSNSGHVGFNTVVNDSMPYMLMASALGIFDDNFSLGSGIKDLLYLYTASRSMTDSRVEGIAK